MDEAGSPYASPCTRFSALMKQKPSTPSCSKAHQQPAVSMRAMPQQHGMCKAAQVSAAAQTSTKRCGDRAASRSAPCSSTSHPLLQAKRGESNSPRPSDTADQAGTGGWRGLHSSGPERQPGGQGTHVSRGMHGVMHTIRECLLHFSRTKSARRDRRNRFAAASAAM